MNVEAINQITNYFCEKRVCNRRPQPLSADIAGLGKLSVQSWEEPAAVVEAFALKTVAAGHGVDAEGVKRLMALFCGKRLCSRQPQQLKLALDMGGDAPTQIVVEPWQDAASVVEALQQAQVEAGVQGGTGLELQSLQQVLAYFCDRKKCPRSLADPIPLAVEGIGRLLVKPDQFVADVVGAFGAEHDLGQEELTMLMQYFCARRPCFKPLQLGAAQKAQPRAQQQQQQQQQQEQQQPPAQEQVNDDEYIDLDLMDDE
jgi:hypothetical protein